MKRGDNLTREQIDQAILAHCGDDTYKKIAWVRSCLLSDDEAESLLLMLDQEAEKARAAGLAIELTRRMRFSSSGVIVVEDPIRHSCEDARRMCLWSHRCASHPADQGESST